MSEVAREAVQYVLETHIMFNVLPNREKRALAPLFEVREFKKGKRLATAGELVDGMYVVYSGEARLKQLVDGKIVSVGTIGQENSLGEMSLLRPVEWQHDVVITADLVALFIPGDKVRALVSEHPAIQEHFQNHVGLIEVSYRLRALLGDASYTRDQFMQLLHNLGVKNIAEGKAVYSQGDEDPRLYYIERGVVELKRTPLSGEPVDLGRVGRGALIGEVGALPDSGTNGVQTHTATALNDVTVLVIRQDSVQLLLEINPGLADRLRLRVRELKDFEDDELNTRKRAEGVDLRIKLAEGVTEDEFLSLEKKQEISKFTVVRQGRETEAAAACLTMLVNHYGKDFTLGQISELTSLNTESANPDQIIRGGEMVGFRAKAYALTFEALQQVRTPAIVGWESYHWVVLYKVTERSVHIADPDGGLQKLKKEDFLKSWSAADVAGVEKTDPNRGVVIAFEPTQRFEVLEPPKNPYRHFINYLLPYKKFFGEAIIAALIMNVLGLASPLFIQTIVDTVVVHEDRALLNMMLAGMVMVTVFTTMTRIAQSLLLAHTTARIDMRLMSEFYRHILSLPMNFFLTRNKGEILTRFGENQKIRAIIAGSTITVLLNLMMIVVYFLMMFGYNLVLTFIVICFIPVYIGIVLYFTPKIKKIAQEIFLTNSQAQSYLIESLNGIESLKATANEYFARARWEEAFAENVNRSFHQQKLALTSGSLYSLTQLGSTIVILWYGANAVMDGSMTIGELMGFNMLMGLVMGPVMQMVNLWNDMQEVRIAVERVGDVLGVDPEQSDVVDSSKLPATVRRLQGRIEFTKVNFSYTTSERTKYIMSDFDLVIEQGMSTAFVGPSGCGKSTIAKMILGFNKPSGGEVLLDGQNMMDLDVYSLRRNIGVVLQDSFIFSGTVAENIALGDPAPDMQTVVEAAKLAGADEFIINYPLGYQTAIGEKGMGISGGQRQRICIARALYHRPKIMIFDEATSALDNESEKRIIQALKPILQNRTSISIAHRLSTIEHVDMICYIADGKVREKGSHKELLDPEYLKEMGYKGNYYGLAAPQYGLPPLEEVWGEQQAAE